MYASGGFTCDLNTDWLLFSITMTRRPILWPNENNSFVSANFWWKTFFFFRIACPSCWCFNLKTNLQVNEKSTFPIHFLLTICQKIDKTHFVRETKNFVCKQKIILFLCVFCQASPTKLQTHSSIPSFPQHLVLHNLPQIIFSWIYCFCVYTVYRFVHQNACEL